MKKNIILVIVLILVWWLYFLINSNTEKQRLIEDKKIWFSFSKLKFENIKTDKFELKNKKINYTWTWKFVTDTDKVNKLISDLKEIKIESVASTNKNNFSKFDITNSWSYVKIDNKKIFLWKNKWFYWEEFIKIDWIDKIYLINKNLKNILDKDIEFFRKHKEKKEENTWTGKNIK